MSIRTVSDCVGCETCIGCKAGKKYTAVFCDKCWQEIEDRVYLIAGKHFCEECALGTLECASAEDLCDEE